MNEITYTSKSPLGNPIKFFIRMGADIKASWRLSWLLMLRDIKAKYRQTYFGYFWAVFPPLINSLLFIALNSAGIVNTNIGDIPYPVFVLSGTIFYQLFIESLNAPLKQVSENRPLLSKIDIPKEALLISGTGQVLFSFFIKIILLILVIIFYQVPVKWTILFILLPFLSILISGVLLGIFLVPLGILYQDIQHIIVLLTSFLMFFTPVAYNPAQGGIMRLIMSYNPLTPMILLMREVLYFGTLENLSTVITILVIVTFLLLIGWISYKLALPMLIERMEA